MSPKGPSKAASARSDIDPIVWRTAFTLIVGAMTPSPALLAPGRGRRRL